mmetsp:Transcript_6107/g.12239  ORF Transcript_6107/g.12239 Transcript_6107/m.12239 type:complete len:106 (-) Transcript_6107:1784-2101(-)
MERRLHEDGSVGVFCSDESLQSIVSYVTVNFFDLYVASGLTYLSEMSAFVAFAVPRLCFTTTRRLEHPPCLGMHPMISSCLRRQERKSGVVLHGRSRHELSQRHV